MHSQNPETACQSQNCALELHNFKIVQHPVHNLAENAQRNLEIVQIPRLHGTCRWRRIESFGSFADVCHLNHIFDVRVMYF